MTAAKTLGKIGIKAFEKREIDPDTAASLGTYTAKKDINGDVVPDAAGNIIVFPFVDGGVVVNEKFRAPDRDGRKVIWQSKGGKRTFWNADALDDEKLLDGREALVITEGEIDAITAIDCGHKQTVSVPDGANLPPKEAGQQQDTPENSGKFEFMWNNRDRLKRVKRFVIATDNDAAGQHLASELVRRLSAARCAFVTYPEGCKDLNDVRRQHGPDAVFACIRDAQPYPVKGVYTLDAYPDAPPIRTFSTGWDTVDELMKVFTPSLVVVTGIPGHGKSTWVLNLLTNLAKKHGWRSAIFSPEIPIVPQMRDKLRRMATDATIDDIPKDVLQQTDRWINDHFMFVEHTVDEEEDLTLEWLLDRLADAVLRYGIRAAVLDPWNEIEHARRRDETGPEYQNRALRALRRFSIRYDVALFVVAHPTKDVGIGGKPRVPTLYDIDGCYSDDTEVLTRRGWSHHGQLTMSDDVACFDLVSGEVRYHQPERIIRREHDGEMYRFFGNSFDMLVTPEHRMVLKPYWEDPVGGNNGRGRPVRFEKHKWHFVEAKDIPNSAFWIPLAGSAISGAEPAEVRIGDRAYPIEPFLKLAGWYISEGHAGPTGITWSQGEGEIAEQFTATFAEASIPAKVGWQRPQKEGWIATGRWYIGNRFCPHLVQWFRDHCGVGSLNKRIPEAFFDLSPRLKGILLHAYLQGDGNKSGTSWRADTISRGLRDDLQRLAVELGVSTSSYESAGAKPNHAARHNVRFRGESRSQVTMRPWQNMSHENYKGLVWCLTVPTGAYFVRRRGYVMVSGNSAAWFNKPDFGVVVNVPDPTVPESMIYVPKVRFDETGEKGSVRMKFDRYTNCYSLLDGRSEAKDHYGKAP